MQRCGYPRRRLTTTEKLRRNRMIVMVGRGEYRIEESELADHIERQLPNEKLRAAPKHGRMKVEDGYLRATSEPAWAPSRLEDAAEAWRRDPAVAAQSWPALAGSMNTARNLVQQATDAMRKQGVPDASIAITENALRDRFAADLAHGKTIKLPPDHRRPAR